MKIGLITMGTGDYIKYLDNNIKTFHKYFFPTFDRKFLCLTDKKYDPPIEAEVLNFPFYKWPLATLYKPKAILSTEQYMKDCDVLFWIDVDLVCINHVTNTDDIFPTLKNPICCVEHCGWLDENGNEIILYPYERSPKSTAYVEDIHKVPYHQACLFGGLNDNFYKMIKTLDKNIDLDLEKDHIAVWHDESHLNRYFQDNMPKSIPKIYARPEAMGDLLPNTKIKSILKPNLNYV
jgi:hypothetical protein